MKAPRACPNSSDSSSDSDSAVQFTGTKGLAARGRAVVDGARDQLLAGARLADHQHGGGRGCHPRDQLVDVEHALALALDLGDRAPAAGRGGGGARLGGQPAALEGARHGQAQLLDVEGLGDVVVGAVADGLHGAGHVAEGGDQDDRRAAAPSR